MAGAAALHRLEPVGWMAAVVAWFAAMTLAAPGALWPARGGERAAPEGLPPGYAARWRPPWAGAEAATAPYIMRGQRAINDSRQLHDTAKPIEDADLAVALERERGRAAPPLLSRTSLLARPPLLAVALAPSGGEVAWLQREATGVDLWKRPLDGALGERGEAVRLLRRVEASALDWSHDGKWLFLRSSRRVVAVAMAGQAGSGVLVRLDGKRASQFVGVDPSHPAAVWLRRDGEGWRRVGPGVDEPLVVEQRPVLDVSVDASGKPALLRLAAPEHQAIVRVHDGAEVARCALATRCSLLPRTGQRAGWMLSDLDGDRQELIALPLSGERTAWPATPPPSPPPSPPSPPPPAARPSLSAPRTAASLPAPPVELTSVSLDPADGSPRLGRRGRELVALEASLAPAVAALRRQLPEGELRVELAAGGWLVRQSVDTSRAERLHLFSPQSGALRPLALAPSPPPWDAPDEAALAHKLPVRWPASDGRWLFGYLTVPPGRDLATAPLVIRAHGGPWSATDAGYDAATQLLANRGALVFEPNFRGSTGMGRDYLLAAGSDFGNGRVQRDILEGARWLLDRGLGDAAKVLAFGASFGGYSALLAATHEPALVRAAVAVAPPTDFGRTLADATRQGETPWHDSGFSLLATLRALGIDPHDAAQRERLYRQSPLGAAAALQRPVLLLAGGRDDRVSLRGVIHYAATLAALGKDVSLFVDAEAGHTLEDPLLREAVLYLLELTLHREAGAPPPAPPRGEVAELLQSRFRLVGPSLQRAGAPPQPAQQPRPPQPSAPPR